MLQHRLATDQSNQPRTQAERTALAESSMIFAAIELLHSVGIQGTTLVATGLTEDPAFTRALLDARNIDRLNIGPVPTIKLNWLQPHEGNIVDFLFRPRAFQRAS